MRVVALNKERAAEEARGLIRGLRPEYQGSDYKLPVTQTFDPGETAAALPDNIIPCPGSLPEQVNAVQSILTAAVPLAPKTSPEPSKVNAPPPSARCWTR